MAENQFICGKCGLCYAACGPIAGPYCPRCGSKSTAPKSKSKGEFRILKATLTAAEFGAVQWAAKRAGENHQAMPLATFTALSVLAAVQGIVQEEVSRGTSIPADVARVSGFLPSRLVIRIDRDKLINQSVRQQSTVPKL